MSIDGVADRVGLPVPAQVDMGNLAARVHPGIGAACPLYQRFFARKRLDRSGEDALHGLAVGLDLPAGKGGAVIFDGQLVAGHD